MIETAGLSEKYAGSAPSISPTLLPQGVFSLCSGGVPANGAFMRLPGKSLRDLGLATGGAISIYQFGQKIVVQRFLGIEIFDLRTLAPNPEDFVYDNEGNQVFDNLGIPVTT